MGQFLFKHGTPLMVDYTPSGSAVAAGDVVIRSGVACIAHNDIADGELGAVAWPNGSCVYEVDEALTYQSGENTFVDGGTLYVESDGTTFSDTATSNTGVGTLIESVPATDLTVGATRFVHE